jgi:NTP pyrophosphatase (non-canonical NTP hydrolase)
VTRSEHLLVIGMEECDEVSQRISKALRFGMDEVQPDPVANADGFTNRERISNELADLLGVLAMLGVDIDSPYVHTRARQKQEKVENYLRYSEECGTLRRESSL